VKRRPKPRKKTLAKKPITLANDDTMDKEERSEFKTPFAHTEKENGNLDSKKIQS
jgi:hypothetical protein